MTVSSAVPQSRRVTLSSPSDLAAAVPYLLGFHPSDSVVALAFRDRRVVCAVRADLGTGPAEPLVRELADAVTRQCPTAVAVLGYGTDDRVRPAVGAFTMAAERRGLAIREALRVHAGRWWSYSCDSSDCCPPEGTQFDPTTSEVAAGCTLAGMAVVASRSELASQVAPLDGPAREAMTAATDRAWDRLSATLTPLPEDESAAAAFSQGKAAVTAAIARYAAGDRLDDEEVAWLALLLQSIPVRDEAWGAIASEQPHLSLWQDVTRRADPELVAAPACLLAFTAYRSGYGPLAGLALERAVAAEPDYSMARLLMHALRHGLPPSAFDGWGTPEWRAEVARGHTTR